MNNKLILCLLLVLYSISSIEAQSDRPPPGQAVADKRKPQPAYDAFSSRGAHHELHPGDLPGSHHYTQLETGLYYIEGSRWRKSKEIIEIIDGYGVATRCYHKAIFKPNPNTVAALHIFTPDGLEFMSHIIGLSYFDSESGNSVLLADIKDSQGVFSPPNQIIYRDCFNGLKADLRYTYTKAGLEQDVVLLEQPPPPEDFGLRPETTRFEVLTEIFRSTQPEKEAKVLNPAQFPEKRGQMADPDLIDEVLEFRGMRMGLNKAFGTGDAQGEEFVRYNNGSGSRPGFHRSGPAARIAKRWVTMDGRQILVEALQYGALQELFASLPSSKEHPDDLKPSRRASLQRDWLPSRKAATAKSAFSQFQVADAPYLPKGLVLDFYLVSTLNDFTFRTGQTYHITGPLHLRGSTVIEPNATLKFAPGASLMIEGRLRCPASGRATLTSETDQPVGTKVPITGFGPAYGSPTLALFDTENGTVIQNLDFRYANPAISLYSPGTTLIVRKCGFFKCITALETFGTDVELDDLDMQWVATPARLLGGGARITEAKPLSGSSYPASATRQASFSLMTEDDHGNSFATATAISPNSSNSGVINYGQDGDVFTVHLPYPGTLTAYTTGTTDTYGYLYDANAMCIVYNDDNPYPNFRFSATVPSGTYYILVRHYSWTGTGPYTLHVEYSATPPTPVPDPVPTTRDHGDCISCAHTIDLNSSTPAAIDWPGDEDFFQIHVNGAITLSAFTSGTTDTYGYILDASGQVIALDDDAGEAYNFSITRALGSGTYYIRVRHYSASNFGHYTLHLTASNPLPTTPAWLNASASVRRINLYWAIVPEAASYLIKRSLTGQPGSFLARDTSTQESYSDTSLEDGTTYYYTVAAVNAAGTSQDTYPVERTTAPAAPQYIVAYGGSGFVYLYWGAPASVQYYRIHRRFAGSGLFSVRASPVFEPWFVDSLVTPGTEFEYMVTGVSVSGAEGLYSPAARAITAPGPPQGLIATPGAGVINLSWLPTSGAASYTVKRSATSGGPYTTVASGITATSFINSGLSANYTCFFVVSASNTSGEGSNSAQAGTTTAPEAPTGLAALAGADHIILNWNACAGAAFYRVKRSDTSGGAFADLGQAHSTLFTDTSLAGGVTRFYVVTAVNSAGAESLRSSEIYATTQFTDNDADGLPDSWELQFFGNLTQNGAGDFDGDGLTNQQEFSINTNPALIDSNGNGIADGYEDYDGDGLPNLGERAFGLDMLSFEDLNANGVGDWRDDTDGDGLPDAYERNIIGSNPAVASVAPSIPIPFDKVPLTP
jgi:hypothetical protein